MSNADTNEQWSVWTETATAPIRVQGCRTREQAERQANRLERHSGNYHVAIKAPCSIDDIAAALDDKAGRMGEA